MLWRWPWCQNTVFKFEIAAFEKHLVKYFLDIWDTRTSKILCGRQYSIKRVWNPDLPFPNMDKSCWNRPFQKQQHDTKNASKVVKTLFRKFDRAKYKKWLDNGSVEFYVCYTGTDRWKVIFWYHFVKFAFGPTKSRYERKSYMP